MTKEYIDKNDVQEKDEESSHQRKTRLQVIKFSKLSESKKCNKALSNNFRTLGTDPVLPST